MTASRDATEEGRWTLRGYGRRPPAAARRRRRADLARQVGDVPRHQVLGHWFVIRRAVIERVDRGPPPGAVALAPPAAMRPG
ncbi:hypothetical protein [Pilimelia anulata]|uniref:hypothetical protein n=1 Tax=Pilimelia anulata TaxID=53371 RepID=UPI001664D71E|nr:hypothetical protein [Pilimelia anulata]